MSNPHTEIPALLGEIRKLDQDIKVAEKTLGRLECKSDSDCVCVTLAGVEFQLTRIQAGSSGYYQLRPVEENNDLRLACINAQKRHLVRLRSKAEGLRWRVRELSKQL